VTEIAAIGLTVGQHVMTDLQVFHKRQ